MVLNPRQREAPSSSFRSCTGRGLRNQAVRMCVRVVLVEARGLGWALLSYAFEWAQVSRAACRGVEGGLSRLGPGRGCAARWRKQCYV